MLCQQVLKSLWREKNFLMPFILASPTPPVYCHLRGYGKEIIPSLLISQDLNWLKCPACTLGLIRALSLSLGKIDFHRATFGSIRWPPGHIGNGLSCQSCMKILKALIGHQQAGNRLLKEQVGCLRREDIQVVPGPFRPGIHNMLFQLMLHIQTIMHVVTTL